MPDKAWKVLERKVAKKLGGKRIPCSGNAGIPGDILHSKYHVECKHRANLALQGWYDKARRDSNGEKPVLLVLKMKYHKKTFVVMDIDDFLKIEGISCQ